MPRCAGPCPSAQWAAGGGSRLLAPVSRCCFAPARADRSHAHHYGSALSRRPCCSCSRCPARRRPSASSSPWSRDVADSARPSSWAGRSSHVGPARGKGMSSGGDSATGTRSSPSTAEAIGGKTLRRWSGVRTWPRHGVARGPRLSHAGVGLEWKRRPGRERRLGCRMV